MKNQKLFEASELEVEPILISNLKEWLQAPEHATYIIVNTITLEHSKLFGDETESVVYIIYHDPSKDTQQLNS